MTNQLDCPALKEMHPSFPPRFYGRVPKTIRMNHDVRSDMPCEGDERRMRVFGGKEYPAWTNKYGAVAAILPDGRMLGVKPDEFEVTEFFPVKEPTTQDQHEHT